MALWPKHEDRPSIRVQSRWRALLTGLVVTALAGVSIALASPAAAAYPPDGPDLDVALTNPTCSTDDDGSITFGLLGLIPGESYHWFLDGALAGELTAEATTAEIPISGLLPGNHVAYVEWVGDEPIYEWRGFAIEPCQPQVTLTVTQCTASGGTGTIGAALSSLVEGVVYTVTGPDGTTSEVVADASSVASLSYSVPAGTMASAKVEGTWTVDEPYEEPPLLGGGDFTPLESVALAASGEATVDPCPAPVVVTPASSTPTPVVAVSTGPTLAATGVDPANPLVAGLILLACGVAALIIDRRRKADRRTGSDEVL